MEVHILINPDVDCCGEDHVYVFATKTKLINFYLEYTLEHYPEHYQWLLEELSLQNSWDKLKSEMCQRL